MNKHCGVDFRRAVCIFERIFAWRQEFNFHDGINCIDISILVLVMLTENNQINNFKNLPN